MTGPRTSGAPVTTPQSRSAARRARLLSRRYTTASLNTPIPRRTDPVTTRDGASLRVHQYGPPDGDVLVLIHGWSCALDYWNPQINAFSSTHRVVAYDQRGHGSSGRGTRRPGPDVLADDLSEVLDAVLAPGQRATLVGHSMGGITVQSWAHHHPDEVAHRASAVVLANTTYGGIATGTRVLPLLNDRVPGPLWLGKALFGAPLPMPGGTVSRAMVRSRIMNRDATSEQADFVLAVTRSCSPGVRAAWALMLAELDLGDAARALTVPTSVVAGRYDRLLPPAMSQRIADVLAAEGNLDRYTVLPTGHAGNVEAEKQFNAEVRRVLAARAGDDERATHSA